MFRLTSVLLLSASSLLISSLASPVGLPEFDNESYRLPGTTVPRHYDISITTRIHAGEFEFFGEVDIIIEAVIVTQTIVLHPCRLTIDDVTLFDVNWNSIIVLGFDYEIEKEFLVISISGNLVPDVTYHLRIVYHGELRDENDVGFYRSFYTDPTSGDTKYLAVTKFEPTDARHAFPCYDEPGLKAKFVISLRHGSTYAAVSNMPVIAQGGASDEMVTTIFDETPLMSTYLVAFIVSDFNYLQSVAPEGVLHRVYAQPHRIIESIYPLETGKAILTDLASLLQVPYSLPTMTQFGVPHFASGAMENWGLVTYGELYLYLNENSSHTRPRSIATGIAHEFAHQWFGNLVTPEWWDYIWLNEGFATLFEYYIPQKTIPEFRTMEFMLLTTMTAMRSDGLSSRPMTYPVNTPTEIRSLFDFIIYAKAGSVLRMMMYAIGEDQFLGALTNYLEDRQRSNANPGHLFASLGEAAVDKLPVGVSFTDVMNSWTLQEGFPIIDVKYDLGSATFECNQTRYFLNDIIDENDPKYFIPQAEAEAGTNTETTVEYWMQPYDEFTFWEIPVDRVPIAEDDWFLFNKDHFGYYRVNYEERNWQLLTEELVGNLDTKISNLNRAQLIDDSFYMWRTNRQPMEVHLNLLEYLVNERDYFPWYVAMDALENMIQTLGQTEAYEIVMDLTRRIIEPALLEIGVDANENDDFYDPLLRSVLLQLACHSDHELCQSIQFDTASQLLEIIEKYSVELDDYRLDGTPVTRYSFVTKSLDESVIESLIDEISKGSDLLTSSDKTNILLYIADNSPRGARLVLSFLHKNQEFFDNLSDLDTSCLLESLSIKSTSSESFNMYRNLVENIKVDYSKVKKYIEAAEAEKD